MKLATSKLCPLHHRRDCCGRKSLKSETSIPNGGRREYVSFEPGVTRIPDEHHPRGYREHRSPSAMRRLLERKIKEQHRLCGICGKEFDDARDIVPDHREPRGLGGARRDDHPENIQATHSLCNLAKGSKRIPFAKPVTDFEVKPSGEIVEDVFGKPSTKRIQ